MLLWIHDTRCEAKLISAKFLMLGDDLSVWDFLSSMTFDDFWFSKFHDFWWFLIFKVPWLFQKILFFQVFQTLWALTVDLLSFDKVIYKYFATQHLWHPPSCSSGWMRKHALMSIFVVGQQRIILTGVLPIGPLGRILCKIIILIKMWNLLFKQIYLNMSLANGCCECLKSSQDKMITFMLWLIGCPPKPSAVPNAHHP